MVAAAETPDRFAVCPKETRILRLLKMSCDFNHSYCVGVQPKPTAQAVFQRCCAGNKEEASRL